MNKNKMFWPERINTRLGKARFQFLMWCVIFDSVAGLTVGGVALLVVRSPDRRHCRKPMELGGKRGKLQMLLDRLY